MNPAEIAADEAVTLPHIERALGVCAKAPTAGWRHNAGYVCVGTLRIARADFDTSPSKARQSEILDYLVSSCNGWEACLLELKRLKTPVSPRCNVSDLTTGYHLCGACADPFPIGCRVWKFCPSCGVPLMWEGL